MSVLIWGPGLEPKTGTEIGTGNLVFGGSHTVIHGTDIPGWENYGESQAGILKFWSHRECLCTMDTKFLRWR